MAQGDFRFTPPLPDPRSLTARLEGNIVEIGLVPFGATLLRLSVYPNAGP
jgi:hypothetical protein